MTPPHPAAADAQAPGRAWELQYLDPAAATAPGRRLAQEGGPLAPDGWLQLALIEARAGDAAQARQALQRSREGFAARGDAVGGALYAAKAGGRSRTEHAAPPRAGSSRRRGGR